MRNEQTEELDKVLKELSNLDVVSSDNKKLVRSKILAIKKILNTKLSETAETEFDVAVFKQFCRELICSYIYKMKRPSTPEDLQLKRNSTKARKPVVEVLSEYEDYFRTDTTALKLSYDNICKSSTLDELKAALKLYNEVLLDREEYETLMVYNNELSELVDEQDLAVRKNKNLRESYEAIYSVLTKDDEKLALALKAKELKNSGMTQRDIASELGANQTSINRALKTFFPEES